MLGAVRPEARSQSTDASLRFKLSEKKAWNEVLGRAVMAGGLLIDDTPGALNQMVSMSYPGSAAQPELGEELVASGRALFEIDTLLQAPE
jgi:hypothetical protein